MDERLQKTAAAVRESGADWALLTSPEAVAYATGHVVAIEAGPSPFAGGPAVTMIGADGACGLVVTNLEAGTASWAAPIATYVGFSHETPADIPANYRDAVASLAKELGVSGTIAVEDGFPFALRDLLGGLRIVPIEPALRRAKSVKTGAEIALLTEAARIASAGQRAFLQAAQAGRSELEIFAEIRLAMETSAGGRLPVTGDLISGREATSAFMGWPGNRRLQAGDPVICDLAPRVAGYWGDSCASVMLGHATPGFAKLFGAAHSALALAIESIRPGLVIGDLDRMLQAHVARHGYAYAHHSGHSIGTGVHEWPRIVSYEDATLQPDMVVMVEPQAFDPEVGGVRLEHMLRVTETGCELLTDFPHQPEV
ncbi:M24 family metallopeptidase [Mangrovicella endophytica]|uniref:M24 family metallopeptidase n=1 Tax=Mangrovicella endophytica TaxID=2066697 RepID=UPI000C9DE3C5|nr:Xaa-Pro peptidase family protein [Mangrovicella endophytica]